jgi:hypothetical protein
LHRSISLGGAVFLPGGYFPSIVQTVNGLVHANDRGAREGALSLNLFRDVDKAVTYEQVRTNA